MLWANIGQFIMHVIRFYLFRSHNVKFESVNNQSVFVYFSPVEIGFDPELFATKAKYFLLRLIGSHLSGILTQLSGEPI